MPMFRGQSEMVPLLKTQNRILRSEIMTDDNNHTSYRVGVGMLPAKRWLDCDAGGYIYTGQSLCFSATSLVGGGAYSRKI